LFLETGGDKAVLYARTGGGEITQRLPPSGEKRAGKYSDRKGVMERFKRWGTERGVSKGKKAVNDYLFVDPPRSRVVACIPCRGNQENLMESKKKEGVERG